ncbi:MAG: hypothetical protein ABSD75_22280 [Terriglobales bacterium]
MIPERSPVGRPIPLLLILLLVAVVHGPLLLMQLPAKASYDTNFHIFFASHYAQHWFNPWNEKWFAGFSQTTYPPLGHQLIALLSYVVGLNAGYGLVQFLALLLLPVGVYRFAKLWVDDTSASYAAVGSVFLGAVAFLVYSAGQLSTILAAPLYLNALPYFYQWARHGQLRSLLKGVMLGLAAASVHHVTLLFGAIFFAIPVLWLAWMDERAEDDGNSGMKVWSRGAVFAALIGIGVAVVLLPYWISILQHPIKQIPIPHASRSNFLFNSLYGFNYFVVPYGAMILALPFILFRGAEVPRLRPLLISFWFAFIFGLGGTTPLPKWLLGRAFDILTFERFTLWASLLALPIVGLLAADLLRRYPRAAVSGLSLAAVGTFALAMAWLDVSPFRATGGLNVDSVVSFLNRDGHDHYRYLTLGFGNALPKISTYTEAPSVDGEYNSARLLPEMTDYGAAQLTSAKFFATAGMDSLRAMLKHANRYGLKYIFVHDQYYEPLLVFAGWRQIETYDGGTITVWSKEGVAPARKIESDAVPAPWEGLLWGILPMGSAVLAVLFLILLPDRRRVPQVVMVPVRTHDALYVREGNS